jgi:hypothetical protein
MPLQIVPEWPVSIRRQEVNRANARKSTGPKTPEGKAKVSANALRHGLCGATFIIDTMRRFLTILVPEVPAKSPSPPATVRKQHTETRDLATLSAYKTPLNGNRLPPTRTPTTSRQRLF